MHQATIPISIQRMVCTGCGAEVNANCNCGVVYVPKAQRAADAIKANPEKSDRAIAKEIGASPTTVGKAREQLSTTGQLEDRPRTGLDGKTRKMPEKKRASETPLPGSKEYERDKAECIRLARNAEDAERKLAEFKAATAKARQEREENIGQENHRNVPLMNSAASIQSAEYHGPIDDEIIAACRRTAQAWDALANKLANKRAAVAGNDVSNEASAATMMAAHAAADEDDLTIPPPFALHQRRARRHTTELKTTGDLK
jgi:DNA-binding transcriptional MocR family regulator